MQLMAQFLFLHNNFKRLVEFVSETVVSSYIKYYRQNEFKDKMNKLTETHFNEEQLEIVLEQDINEVEVNLLNLAKDTSKIFCSECRELGKEFFKSKIDILIENSLESSECEQVIEITKKITKYKAMEKLKQWININLNEKIFYDDLKIKKFKKSSNQKSAIINDTSSKDTTINKNKNQKAKHPCDIMPSEMLNSLQVLNV
jgi:hypothetical protein